MDPFELLKKDHQKVSALFKQIEAASGQAKLRIFRQLKEELDVHAHVEETIFYPALEREPQTRDITREAYEEHRVVKDLLAQLEAARSADEDWEARLTVLKENVEHHVDEEEGELFDKASEVLTGDQADRLGDEMQAEKNRQQSGSPAKTSQAKPSSKAKPKKPGLIRSIANALGLGSSDSRASKKTTRKKPTKATKKAAPKSSKKSRPTGKKAAAKQSRTTKAAKKRKPAAKRGQKTTKRSAKR